MPIKNKSLYPANWKTEIRPAVLERAGNRCEVCKVPNKAFVLRGTYRGVEAFQDDDSCEIFKTENGESMGYDYAGSVWTGESTKSCKIVLTVAHLNNDTTDNRMENLKAMCQKCHLTYDSAHHAHNARQTREKKKGLQQIPFE